MAGKAIIAGTDGSEESLRALGFDDSSFGRVSTGGGASLEAAGFASDEFYSDIDNVE